MLAKKIWSITCKSLDTRDVILTVSDLKIASSYVTTLMSYQTPKNSK